MFTLGLAAVDGFGNIDFYYLYIATFFLDAAMIDAISDFAKRVRSDGQ